MVCLAKHGENECRFKGCRKCGKQHNCTLIHESVDNIEIINTVSSISAHATRHAEQSQILLSTVIVKIQSKSK